MIKGFWAISALGFSAACMPAADFVCAESAQCTRLVDGVCQTNGYCSYPDSTCDSGQRYSGFAGAVASTCVEVVEASESGSTGGSSSTGESSSTGDAESSSSGSGPIPDSCDEIDCTGGGTCVEVDGMPTCACDPGLYPVGLACLEDPCDTVNCRFVDADMGDDAADGSRQAPWRTLERLEQALAEATPGDHFLLRRGRQWDDEDRLDITVTGTSEAPIVIGAYGPVGESKPRLVSAEAVIDSSEQFVLRDLWFQGSSGPCIKVEDSRYVVVLGNTADQCEIRGIRVDQDSAYTVVADNTVTNVLMHAGIFLADTFWDNDAELGPHHWVIDNVVVGGVSDGIAVSDTSTTETMMPVSSIDDIKIVGNTVVDVDGWGLLVNIDGAAWAVGNTIIRGGDELAGGGLGMLSDGSVTGNVIVHSRVGIELRGRGIATHNTIVQETSASGLLVSSSARDRVITDNLVLARGGALWVNLLGDDLPNDIATMDLNWYATDGEPCVLRAMGMELDLPGFTDATSFDANSTCESVPDFGAVPTGVLYEDLDSALWPALQPGDGWPRCDDPAGARDCEGEPVGVRIDVIPEVGDNEGLGWAGPLLVRQRYDTSP